MFKRHSTVIVLVLMLGLAHFFTSLYFIPNLAGRKGVPGGRVGGGTRHSLEEVVHVG